MSFFIENDQCYCTVMPFEDKPVGADPFCTACEGTGKVERRDSLYEKLLKQEQQDNKEEEGDERN